MKNFYQFYTEIIDAIRDTTDDINLQGNPDHFIYQFKDVVKDTDGSPKEVSYLLKFNKEPIIIYDSILTNEAYGIELLYLKDNSYEYRSSGLGNGPTIYRHVIRAVKKLIEQENPEGLYFYGYEFNQDITYNKFYTKMLSQYYTQINKENYIRNDLLKEWKETNDERFALVQNSMNSFHKSGTLELYKKEKIENRQKKVIEKRETQQKIANINNIIGKIIWDANRNIPIYVEKFIAPDTLQTTAIDKSINQAVQYYVKMQNAKYIREVNIKLKDTQEIEKLKQLIFLNYNKNPKIAF